ncbi:MAG: energy transducer TonB, partial [Lautropia mirabilis]|nr:energy transducer TonB [Lautropia mirabilis]MBF1262907.1 energy transducer TonB [Lautropia mirabilis]
TPPVQGEPNAPAGATPQQGSGTPGPVGPPPVLGSSQITYIRQPKPVYPAFSKRAGETGKVMLRVLVDVNGRPKEVKLEKSSGSDRLDKAAIDAARNALLSPHKENGKPREAYVLMPIVFELEN